MLFNPDVNQPTDSFKRKPWNWSKQTSGAIYQVSCEHMKSLYKGGQRDTWSLLWCCTITGKTRELLYLQGQPSFSIWLFGKEEDINSAALLICCCNISMQRRAAVIFSQASQTPPNSVADSLKGHCLLLLLPLSKLIQLWSCLKFWIFPCKTLEGKCPALSIASTTASHPGPAWFIVIFRLYMEQTQCWWEIQGHLIVITAPSKSESLHNT